MSNTLQSLMKCAHAGDAEAQFKLAEAYRVGEIVEGDYLKAMHWYRTSAEQGHSAAQNDLGTMFLNGIGMERNPEEAAKWYARAAVQGEASAQFNLGMRYATGTGLQQDDEQAVLWFTKAAEQGDVEAIGELGTFYRFGRGVEQNYIAAAEFHVVAAMEGDIPSIANLGDYQQELEKAAIAGSVVAAICLAKMYDHGLGVKADEAYTYAWLQYAEQHGSIHNEPDTLDELASWKALFSMALSPATEKQSSKLLRQMKAKRKRAA